MKLILEESSLDDTVRQFFYNAEKSQLERREGQVEMALEISDAVLGKYPLAVEAGVGIGKSIAYLVPLVINFFRERRQVIIATSTIALQEQLEKDLHNILTTLGVKAEVINAMGMKNYVCGRRLKNRIRSVPDDSILKIINKKYVAGITERKELRTNIPEAVWNGICISSFGERCNNCAYRYECRYYEMRTRLRTANCFVICNQNMLVSHLISRNMGGAGIFNNNIRTIVIDEAHNIEAKFRDAYTLSMNKWQIINELKNVMKKLKNKNTINETIAMLNTVFRFLESDVKHQKKNSDGDMETFYYNETSETRDLFFRIRRNMVKIEESAGCSLYSLDFLRKVCNIGKKNLIWLDDSSILKICICKKDIRTDISKMLYKRGVGTILTSATLSSGGINGYDYFLDSIGYPNTAKAAEPKSSSFDYDKNTMLYTTSALPYPSKNDREEYCIRAIPEIVRLLDVTKGKALILFTAKTDMEYVYKKLSNMDLPYNFIMQGSGPSQEYLIRKFRDDTDSVLLGTGTFWEGINVEGEALSQVIIYKLPFPVPNPIIDYKMSLVKDPIGEVAVPEMIIKLKQGTGRLIRSSNDRGIFSILDPRVSTKSKSAYTDKTICSMLTSNRTESIDYLSDFWNRVNDEKEDS